MLIDNDKKATLNLTEKTQWGVQDVIFLATDLDSDFDSDTVRVIILDDDIPTVFRSAMSLAWIYFPVSMVFLTVSW